MDSLERTPVSMIHFETQKLSYAFPQKKILDEISFTLPSQKITGILGPNGTGKTTLLKLLLGFLNPMAGKILLNHREMGSYPRKEIARHIAYVPQFSNLTFDLNVFEYVLLGRAPHLKGLGFESLKDIDCVKKTLQDLNIFHLKARFMHSLSGGEHQRVLIAKALCQNTEILILDEPTSHLDLKAALEILSLLKNLSQARKISILMVLHDPVQVSEFCDEVLFLNHGKIQAMGSVLQLMTEENLYKTFQVQTHIDKNPFTGKQRIT